MIAPLIPKLAEVFGSSPGVIGTSVPAYLIPYGAMVLVWAPVADRYNAILHSGIFTWLGLYFDARYGLGETGIGLAILGYGVPGFLFGPPIGRLADRYGRARLIPLGLALGAAAALLLAAHLHIVLAALVVALLSLGYDLTQPLLAGIVTDLSAKRGQAMGLNVFTPFVGFGLGSFVFQLLLPLGFSAALAVFGLATAVATLVALPLFASEVARPSGAGQG